MMLNESLERAYPSGQILHAGTKNGRFTGVQLESLYYEWDDSCYRQYDNLPSYGESYIPL